MEIQAGSHNGDPGRSTQWRFKPVHTMEIQAGSHNGDPKQVHTMEIQISSQEFSGNPFQITWPMSSFERLIRQWLSLSRYTF